MKQLLLELLLKLANRYLSVDEDWNLYISNDSWKHEQDTRTEEEKYRWESAVKHIKLLAWQRAFHEKGMQRIADFEQNQMRAIAFYEHMKEFNHDQTKTPPTPTPIEGDTSD